jgi:hypothetical protein
MTSDDPLKGSGITVLRMPILLLDDEWQQLRHEASERGCHLESTIAQILRAHIVRRAVRADLGYPSE